MGSMGSLIGMLLGMFGTDRLGMFGMKGTEEIVEWEMALIESEDTVTVAAVAVAVAVAVVVVVAAVVAAAVIVAVVAVVVLDIVGSRMRAGNHNMA